MAWTEAQWETARRVYEHAQSSAMAAARALNSVPDETRARVSAAAGPAGQATVRAAQALSAPFPSQETRRTERTAVQRVRAAITYANRFQQVDTRLLGARQRGTLGEDEYMALLDAGWRDAKNDVARAGWQESTRLPGVRQREPQSLTSQSDPPAEPAEPASSEQEPSAAEAPSSSTTTRRRRRRSSSGFGRINPWPIALALGIWLFGRR